jgi:hypothetical protein
MFVLMSASSNRRWTCFCGGTGASSSCAVDSAPLSDPELAQMAWNSFCLLLATCATTVYHDNGAPTLAHWRAPLLCGLVCRCMSVLLPCSPEQ